MQTPDDYRRMADSEARTAELLLAFGDGDRGVTAAWHAMILYGAADEIERRRRLRRAAAVR